MTFSLGNFFFFGAQKHKTKSKLFKKCLVFRFSMFAPSWDGVDQKGMFVVVAEYSIMRTRLSKLQRVDWTIPLILQVNLDVSCRAQER